MTPRHLRASQMPLAMTCAGSVHPEPDEPLIDPVNEAAELGSAVHEIMAEIVREGLDYVPECVPVAQRWGVDADELAGLAGAGLKCWRKIDHWLEDRIVEQEMGHRIGLSESGVLLTGHADVVGWHDDKTLLVVDWKTGRLDADHYDQMAAYALLARETVRADSGLWAERVLAIPVWLRDAELEVYSFDRRQLLRWEQSVEDDVLDWDGTYHPGPHCQHCPRFASCPARRAMVRQAVADLTSNHDEDIEAAVSALVDYGEATPFNADIVADVYERSKMVADIAERFKKALREQLSARGGTLEGNNKRISVETQNRRYLKTRKAWSVLSQHVEPDRLLDACTLSRTKALELITADVQRGGKKAKRQEVEAELDEAGAVEAKEIKRLSVKRTPASIEQRSDSDG